MEESKVSQLEAQKESRLNENLDKKHNNVLLSSRGTESNALEHNQNSEAGGNKERTEEGYDLLTELSKFKAENSSLREELEILKDVELSAMRKVRKDHMKANKRRREKEKSMLKELSNSKAENVSLRENSNAMKNERDNAFTLLKEQESEVSDLETQLAVTKVEQEAFIDENSCMKKNVDAVTRERDNAVKALKEEESKVSELGVQLAAIKVELKEAFTDEKYSTKKNGQAVTRECDNEVKSLKDEESKVSELDVQLADTKIELNALALEKLGLENMLNSKMIEVGEALKILDDLKTKLSSTASNFSLDEPRSRLNEKENGEPNDHLSKLVTIRNEVNKLDESPKLSLSNEYGLTTGEISKLTDEINRLKEKIRAEDEVSTKKVSSLEEKLMEERVERRRMHNLLQELRGNIRVFARVRPFLPNDKVKEGAESRIVPMSETGLKIITNSERDAEDIFSFDHIFPPSSSQEQVFTEVSDFVQSALDGYNVCLFSYGQTGSGKTYTMQGSSNGSQMQGIIPRAIKKVSEYKAQLESDGWQYTMQVSFLEIYNETIHDLLRKNDIDENKHEVKSSKDGNERYVSDITMITIDPSDVQAVKKVMRQALKQMSFARTKMNARSSRSHSVFTLHMSALHSKNRLSLKGSLNLVDLAGSERLDRVKNTGDRAKETMAINKSLSALTRVFTAISMKDSHIPFRDSTLTKLLEPSFSGNGKTLMLVNLSPTDMSLEESLFSLRFASNVKKCTLGKAKRFLKYNKPSRKLSSRPSSKLLSKPSSKLLSKPSSKLLSKSSSELLSKPSSKLLSKPSSIKTRRAVKKKEITEKSSRNLRRTENKQIIERYGQIRNQTTAENSGERRQLKNKSYRGDKAKWRS